MARRNSIDRLDMRIMEVLERNGRMTRAELSEAAGLSATPCGTRVAKLEAKGHIRGYHANVDIERLSSLQPFMVTIGLKQWAPECARRFEELVTDIPHIVECHAVFGVVDYIMRVLASGPDHCEALLEPLRPIGLDCTSFPVSRAVLSRRDSYIVAVLV